MAGQQHLWQLTFDVNNAGTVFSHQPLDAEYGNVCLIDLYYFNNMC